MLDIHAPRKKKYVKSKHVLLMNKALSKEILTKTRL